MKSCFCAQLALVLLALAVTGPTFARSLKQGIRNGKVNSLASPLGTQHATASGLASQLHMLQPSNALDGTARELPRAAALTGSPRLRKLHSVDGTDRVKYWINAASHNFWEAEATCNYYGGKLAVLESADEIPETLETQTSYWIGLFNTKELPGADGSWSWVDHSPYAVGSSYVAWAAGEPQPGLWCAIMRHNGNVWEWAAANCTSSHAMFCELAADGTSVRQPLSCVHGAKLEGTALEQPMLQTALPSQVPQLCAEACLADHNCAAFTATSGSTCQLFQRGTTALTLASDPEGSTVSCLRYGLDFVTLGQAAAAAAGLSPDADLKCITGYAAGFDEMTSQPAASIQECEQQCAPLVECSVFEYNAGTGICRLGDSPVLGTNVVATGPAENVTTCMLSNEDWLRLGSWADPSTLSVIRSGKMYTMHREQLSFEDAAAACAAQPRNPGRLVTFGSLPDMAYVIIKLFIEHTLDAVVPAAGVAPGTHGAWVGLQGDATDFLALLAGGSADVQWVDGTPINATLLQHAWVVDKAGQTRMGLPVHGDTCVIISADRSLLKAGFSAAGGCNWTLPFVCEADLPEEVHRVVPKPPPSPGTPTAPMAPMAPNMPAPPRMPDMPSAPRILQEPPPVEDDMWGDMGGSVGTLDPFNLDGELGERGPETQVPSIPTMIPSPDSGGGLMWMPVLSSRGVTYADAQRACAGWGGSLVALPSAAVQMAVTSTITVTTDKFWMNLAVNGSIWSWGAPNTLAQSVGMLVNYTDWCQNIMPPPAPPSACAALKYDAQQCDGWHWSAEPCSSTSSFVCQLPPAGTPSTYYCTLAYALAGEVIQQVPYPSAPDTKTVATYCSSQCTADARCHAFTTSGTTCNLIRRTTLDALEDFPSPGVDLACFKYGLLNDVMGSVEAVRQQLATDPASSRVRCVMGLEVKRTDISTRVSTNCSPLDCMEDCDSSLRCTLAMFEPVNITHCKCTLARRPLDGVDGANAARQGALTCTFGSDDFERISLMVGSNFIIKTPGSGGGADSSWGGSGPNNNNGDIDWGDWDNVGGTNSSNGIPSNPIIYPPPSPDPPPPPSPEPPSPNPPSPEPPSPAPPLPPSNTTDNSTGSGGSNTTSPPMPLPPSPSPDPAPPPRPDPAPPPSPDPTPPPSPTPSPPAPNNNTTPGNGSGTPSTGTPPPVETVPSPSPPPSIVFPPATVPDKSSGGSSFGMPEMIGVTVGFCGGVLVLVLLVCTVMVRRRRSAAHLAALQDALPPSERDEKAGGGMSNRNSGFSTFVSQWLLGPVPPTSLSPAAAAFGTAKVIKAAPGSDSVEGPDSTLDAHSLDSSIISPRDHLTLTSTPVDGMSVHSSRVSGGGTAAFVPVPAPGELAAVEACSAMTSKSGISSSYITLSKLLGAGSFGTVYQGTWRRQTVAVKIIPHSPAAAQRVKNEVELSMAFDHPNVVRSFFYETFDARAMSSNAQLEAATAQRESQETWIVLEYCDCGSLASRLYSVSNQLEQPAAQAGEQGADHLQQNPLGDMPVIVPCPMHERDSCIASMPSILMIAQGVARGMAYMHSLSICHGDLKCENVLLSSCAEDPSQAVAKIGDFGLSRAMGDGTSAASHLSTATVGTVTHMPPELLLSGRLRPSCDVYSFGIMLWQLYTGAVPYSGMRYAEIVYKVAVCNLRPVFPNDTPAEYRQLAEQCWQSDAAARPSFDAVVGRLQAMLDNVDRLEAERLGTLPNASQAALCTSRGSSGRGAHIAEDDITLQSPWIAMCPHTGSSNGGFGMNAMAAVALAALGSGVLEGPTSPEPGLPHPATFSSGLAVTAHVTQSSDEAAVQLPLTTSKGFADMGLPPKGSIPLTASGSTGSAQAVMENYLAYKAGLAVDSGSGSRQ